LPHLSRSPSRSHFSDAAKRKTRCQSAPLSIFEKLGVYARMEIDERCAAALSNDPDIAVAPGFVMPAR
jgi:hypothetical protein